MAITTTYNVVGMTTVPSLDGLSNVVTTVTWQVVGTDSDTGVSAVRFGIDQLGPPNISDFTQYSDLTEAQVLSWIPDHQTNPTLLESISNEINAPVFPPWGAS